MKTKDRDPARLWVAVTYAWLIAATALFGILWATGNLHRF